MNTGTVAGLLILMGGFALAMMGRLMRWLAEEARREGDALDALVDDDLADQLGCWSTAVMLVGIVIIVFSWIVALVDVLF